MESKETTPVEREICSRCSQMVVPQNKRCPRCGSPMAMRSRRWPLMFGVAGVLALAFLVFLMLKVIENDDIENTPSSTEQTSQ